MTRRENIMGRDLYLAATTGDNDGIMASKDKIMQVTSEGKHTVLHLAAMYNKNISVDAILKKFPDLLMKQNLKGETALHLAAKKGYFGVVKLLIAKSNDLKVSEEYIRKANEDGDTALHFAAQDNHREVVEEILKADPSDQHSQNKKYETPLYLAALMGHKNVIQSILGSCKYAAVDGPDGQTVLHAAVMSRNADCVELILQLKGHEVDKADSQGLTAMHYAAYHNCVSLLQIIEKSQPTQHYDGKTTPLHIAASKGHISTVQELMKLYGSPTRMKLYGSPTRSTISALCAAVDEHKQNILHLAVSQKHTELVKFILDEYDYQEIEKLLVRDENGNTPFHLLVMSGCFSAELIKHPQLQKVLNYQEYGQDKDVQLRAKNNAKFTPADLLYYDDDVLGDQLQIKEALEDIQNGNKRNIWGARSGPQIRTSELVPLSIRSRKDAKFEIERRKQMEEKVKLYRKMTGTQIIVTALITTVTFTVGFTMPGGYHQNQPNEGSSVLSRKRAFVICMVADAIALLCSTTSLFFYFISSLYQDPDPVSILDTASVVLNIISLGAMMGTFMLGTYVVLPHSALAIIMLCIPAIFLPLAFILSLRWVCFDRRKVIKDHLV